MRPSPPTKRVHSTTPSGKGSPEATPCVNSPDERACAQAVRGAAAVSEAAAMRERRAISMGPLLIGACDTGASVRSGRGQSRRLAELVQELVQPLRRLLGLLLLRQMAGVLERNEPRAGDGVM